MKNPCTLLYSTRRFCSPLRARSRCAISSKYSRVPLCSFRNSSNSAEYPAAITPPSRKTDGGFSAIARFKSARAPSGGAQSAPKVRKRGDDIFASCDEKSGNAFKVARSPDKSRGRAENKAMRAAILSKSAKPAMLSRSESNSAPESNSATASCRAEINARSRGG